MTAPVMHLLLQSLTRGVGGGAPSALNPAGPAATSIARFGVALIVVAAVVFVVVLVLLVWPIVRTPADAGVPRMRDERRWEFRWIVVGGALVPMLILAGVFVFSLGVTQSERQPRSIYVVDVIGHQWWWEIRYRNEGVITANELHIPVGHAVRIRLASDDVIHSFWVPQLQGKTDAIPGQMNETWLRADTAGVYRGECAEFCGAQHAHMAFVVVAEPMGDYAAWVAQQRKTAATPTDSSALIGEQVFLTQPCSLCHSVRGTAAGGQVGPDLTHVASRRTLASGTLDNSRGNLAAWIENPDRLKPGTKMPPVPLDGPTLQALVTYLETLR